MPRLRTSLGQLLVNEALPEELRDYNRTLDKKNLTGLLSTLAQNHPEKYRDVSFALNRIGQQAAYSTGGHSFGLRHIRTSPVARKAREALQQELRAIDDDDSLSDDAREEKIIRTVGKLSKTFADDIYKESLDEDNPLALQILSGARGNKTNLASLRGGDLLYTDHRDRVMPIPVLRSYSQGLSPAEYWAGAYGARKGVVDTKLAIADAGYLGKQLSQMSHRAVVTDLDGDGEPDTLRGYPVDSEDADNEGALLAAPAGKYPRNTILTPKILADLRGRGVKRLLVRSPITGGTPEGGVYARDAGVREFGRLPQVGEQLGLAAAQSLAEPLAQGSLSSKHSGGVASSTANQAVSGFKLVDQLVQVPKTFKGGAAHATLDGTVGAIADAPAGGKFVTINGQQHYVAGGFGVKVKPGDKVEAGDVISEGVPNPAVIVQHKGIGEGRRYFIDAFRNAYRDAGIKSHRRNIELLARSLVNHVRLTDEVGDYAPDDVVPYNALESSYQPRAGAVTGDPRAAVGKYLERPYLHYSIGTKIKPSMLRDFQDFGITSVAAHADPPPFEAEMVRGMQNLQHDPDWQTRMFGSGLKGTLLQGVARGGHSDERGTSFVPGLAKGINFGRVGVVQTPKPAPPLPPEQEKLSGAYQEADDHTRALEYLFGLTDQHDNDVNRVFLDNDRMQKSLREDTLPGQLAAEADRAGEWASYGAWHPAGWLPYLMRKGEQVGNDRIVPHRYSDGRQIFLPTRDYNLLQREYQLAPPVGSPEERSKYTLPELGPEFDPEGVVGGYNQALLERRPYSADLLMQLGDAYKKARPELWEKARQLRQQTIAPQVDPSQVPAPYETPPAAAPSVDELWPDHGGGPQLGDARQVQPQASGKPAEPAEPVPPPSVQSQMYDPEVPRLAGLSLPPRVSRSATPPEELLKTLAQPSTPPPDPSKLLLVPPRNAAPIPDKPLNWGLDPGMSQAAIINGGRHEYKAVPMAPPKPAAPAAVAAKPAPASPAPTPAVKSPLLAGAKPPLLKSPVITPGGSPG